MPILIVVEVLAARTRWSPAGLCRRRFRHRFGLGGLLAVVLSLVVAAPAAAYLSSQDFSQDPGWEGQRNRLVPSPCPQATQDFGWSQSDLAGGSATGEVGGLVWRSLTPAWYGKELPRQTLDNHLDARGRLKITTTDSTSGALIGWFNSDSSEWRMRNSLVMRLGDVGGDSDHVQAYFEYGTENWRTQGRTYERGGSTFYLERGRSYQWRLSYDPTGGGGAGRMRLEIDGQETTLDLRPEDRADGAFFSRFGVTNLQIPGGGMRVYIDDLVLDGQSQDLAADPGWNAHGNRVSFADCRANGAHDFGWDVPGARAGGLVWRTEQASDSGAWYGDRVEGLDLNVPLHADGTVTLARASSDSATYFGWFDADQRGETRPRGFLGVLVEGPSRIGQFFRPVYRPDSPSSLGADADGGSVLNPSERAALWSIDYVPLAVGGGLITVSLDGRVATLPVSATDRALGGSFDHFGIRSMESGGHSQTLYLDNLTYTSAPGLFPPSRPAAPIVQNARARSGPRLGISRRRVRLSRSGAASVRVRCGGSGFCQGRGRLESARKLDPGATRPLYLGRQGFQIPEGRTQTIRFRLSRSSRAVLKRLGEIRVRASLVAIDSGGLWKTSRRSFTLLAR